jgi:hypothetical protein
MEQCAFGLLIDCKENYETVFYFLLTAVFALALSDGCGIVEMGSPAPSGKSPKQNG